MDIVHPEAREAQQLSSEISCAVIGNFVFTLRGIPGEVSFLACSLLF